MATISLGGTATKTNGTLPAVGTKLPSFTLSAVDLSSKRNTEFSGSRLLLNIFPSVDTGVCAASARKFNEAAAKLDNTKVLCISRDLPFAQSRFCASEGLLARAIVIVDKDHTIVYTELVPEIGQEPDYKAALNHLM